MRYRDVFLQANPHAVLAAIGWTEIEMDGKKIRLPSTRTFKICQGFNIFAKGYKYEVDEQTEKEQIWRKNPDPGLSSIHVPTVYNHLRSAAGAAIEALGIIGESNIDKYIQTWLDQDVIEYKDDNANAIAITILAELIKD